MIVPDATLNDLMLNMVWMYNYDNSEQRTATEGAEGIGVHGIHFPLYFYERLFFMVILNFLLFLSSAADDAAVNINIWLTSSEDNLDQEGSGLVIYDKVAETGWRQEGSGMLLRGEWYDMSARFMGSKNTTVAYRQNRMVLFNSELYHRTAPLHFRPGYKNRRINLTYLYGVRINDRLVHRRALAGRARPDIAGGEEEEDTVGKKGEKERKKVKEEVKKVERKVEKKERKKKHKKRKKKPKPERPTSSRLEL
jgi:hypothetical protein